MLQREGPLLHVWIPGGTGLDVLALRTGQGRGGTHRRSRKWVLQECVRDSRVYASERLWKRIRPVSRCPGWTLLVRSENIIENTERRSHHRFGIDLVRQSQSRLIAAVIRRRATRTHVGIRSRDRVLVIEEILAGVVVEGAEPGEHPHGSHVIPAQTEVKRPLCARAECVLHIPGVSVEKERPVRWPA